MHNNNYFLLIVTLSILQMNDVSSKQHDSSKHWSLFKKLYMRNYNEVEDTNRQEIFNKNIQLITRHNLEADLGVHSFWLEVNRFTDLTNEEYRQYLGYSLKEPEEESHSQANIPSVANSTYFSNPWDIPPHMDWRNKPNVVSGVKDQGDCSASWAFASISSLESQWALATGSLVPLSEQQVIDCSLDFGNEGCSGAGLTYQSFNYMKAAGGVDSFENYPYSGEEDNICKFTRANVTAKVGGFVNVLPGDELVLKDAVANVGPIAAAIDAGSEYFQFYSRGIFDHDDCQKDDGNLNHAVTLVGYGTEFPPTLSGNNSSADYWIVKNSWGPGWGDNGYVKIARNKDNLCGIASRAMYPLVKNF